jgi:lysophospholipase L1-like esterase
MVFYEGDNDLNAGKTPQQVRDGYATFVAKVQKGLPDTKFFILAVKPSVARIKLIDQHRETNRLLKELAAKDPEHLTFVDVFTPMLGKDGQPRPELYVEDKLHMNAEGYKIWTAILKPLLK